MEFYMLSGFADLIARETADEHIVETADLLIKSCLAAQRTLITLVRVVQLERTMLGKGIRVNERRINELEASFQEFPEVVGDLAEWFTLSDANWRWALECAQGFSLMYYALMGKKHPLQTVLLRMSVDALSPVLAGNPVANTTAMVSPFIDGFDYMAHRKRYFKTYRGRVTWTFGMPSWWADMEWRTRFASPSTNDRIVT